MTAEEVDMPQAELPVVAQAIGLKLIRSIECIAMAEVLAEWYRDVDARGWVLHLPAIGTLYDGMWDAAILSQGTIWDRPKATEKTMLSLPRLAARLQPGADMSRFDAVADSRKKLTRRRDKIVAHSEYIGDLDKHEAEFGLDLTDLWKDVEMTAGIVGPLLGSLGIWFDLEDERHTARQGAQRFLSVLRSGMEKQRGDALKVYP